MGKTVVAVMLAWCAIVSASPPDTSPKLVYRSSSVGQGVTTEAVMEIMEKARPALLDCYKQARVAEPDYQEQVRLTFALEPDGTVKDAKLANHTQPVDACILPIVAKLVFAPTKQTADVPVLVEVDMFTYRGGGGGRRSMDPPPQPMVMFSSTSSEGEPATDTVTAVLDGTRSKLQTCYEKALAKSPDLRVELAVTFSYRANGKAQNLRVTGTKSAALTACVSTEIKRAKFPKPATGTVKVTTSFTAAIR